MRDRRQGKGPRNKKGWRAREGDRSIEGDRDRGRSKRETGLGWGGVVRSVTKRQGEKTTRRQRKGEVEEGEEAIQKERRQKDCGERAGVP